MDIGASNSPRRTVGRKIQTKPLNRGNVKNGPVTRSSVNAEKSSTSIVDSTLHGGRQSCIIKSLRARRATGKK